MELIVTSVPKSSALNWLGVYFDFRLFFVNHAEKMAAKDHLAANGCDDSQPILSLSYIWDDLQPLSVIC